MKDGLASVVSAPVVGATGYHSREMPKIVSRLNDEVITVERIVQSFTLSGQVVPPRLSIPSPVLATIHFHPRILEQDFSPFRYLT